MLQTDEEIAIASAPRGVNNFLRMQRGIFLYIPKANQFLLGNKEWPSIEDTIQANSSLHRCLKRYSIATSQADDLLRILFKMDITRHHLMPTLGNAAQTFSYLKGLFDF